VTDRTFLAGLVLAFLVLLLALMYLGWRRRRRRQSGIPRPLPVPAERGADLAAEDGLYVATTSADEPLDRIAVGGLGFRARASVAVSESGVVLALAGEPDAFIPAGDLRGVDRSTAVIDRVVERGGLARIAWTLGGTPVDSYLRLADAPAQRRVIAAIESILPEHPGTDGGSGTRA